MDFSEEKLDEKFQSVPRDIRLALSSPQFVEKIFAVGKKHELLLDETETLSETVALIMLGLLPREQFQEKMRELGIPEETITALTKDINENVFAPIKESLIAKEEDEELGSREDLLREIENPSPALVRTVPSYNPPSKASLAEMHNSKVLGSEENEKQNQSKGGPLTS